MRSPHTPTGEQPPLLITRESLCVGVKTQHRQKQINEQILKKKHLDPIFQHDQPTSIQAMNRQQHLATFTSSKEQNSPKVSERLHQLTLCLDISVLLSPVFHQLHRRLVSLYTPLLFGALGLERLDQMLHPCAPTPPCCCHPPSHQLNNKLLNLPFTVDPHPLASCLKQRRSQCTIVKWVNQ